jgi:hypothetical protein
MVDVFRFPMLTVSSQSNARSVGYANSIGELTAGGNDALPINPKGTAIKLGIAEVPVIAVSHHVDKIFLAMAGKRSLDAMAMLGHI